MALHIEANSLSEISQLAANPPRYPRNPTELPRKPLTLYISRVPGSKDIILTTLKPRLKSVNAEDVLNSLYYLHFNTDDDARFLGDNNIVLSETKKSNPARVHSVQRKALPESTEMSLGKGGGKTIAHFNTELKSEVQTAVEGTREVPEHFSPNPPSSSIRRKPLGPRALVTDHPTCPNLLREDTADSIDALKSTNLRHSVDSSPLIQSERDAWTDSRLDGKLPSDDKTSTQKTTSFCLNLIRRDPAAGTQINIGTVSGQLVAVGETPVMRKPWMASNKMYPTINVHITSPGYNQFREPHIPRPTVVPRSDLEKVSEDNTSQHLNSCAGFYREVHMDGSGFWTRQTKLHQRALSHDAGRDSPKNGHGSDSASFEGTSHNSDSATSEPKGYVFTSLWGGRCKFSTGGGGRSLRCRHKLPAPASASNTTDSRSPPEAPLISELRFNLPSASILKNLGVPDSASKPKAEFAPLAMKTFGHIRDKIAPQKSDEASPPLPPRPHGVTESAEGADTEEKVPPLPPRPRQRPIGTDSCNEDEMWDNSQGEPDSTFRDRDTHWDLSLGQEKAGGGSKGKHAKLGKLIIYDEGFKMLDLVVAANMGIWWVSWESEYR